MDQTFRAVTRSPGIIIWRIEKMELVQVPEKSYGSFFEGDCYMLLFTQKVGNSLSYNIHYWIGSQSTQDEQGSAAIYTVQLDEFLGSSPVQYREVQDHESDTFKGYFKQGIIYKKGGVASGMRHTETNTYDVKRLLHVKGKKRVIAKEVEMSWKSLTFQMCFCWTWARTSFSGTDQRVTDKKGSKACCWPKTSETEREEVGQRSEWWRVKLRAVLLRPWSS